MKILFALLLAVGFGVSATHATSEVLSVNAVGYIKADLTAGKLAMLQNTFLTMDGGDATPSKLFGDDLPVGTRVFVWDAQAEQPGYRIARYQESFGPPPNFTASTNWSEVGVLLNPGDGLWVDIPDDGVDSSFQIYFMGEVPASPNIELPIVEGLNLIGPAYPVDVVFSETSLGQAPSLDDAVFVWNNEEGGYTISRYQESFGPPPTFTASTNWTRPELVIPANQGFWYQSNASRTWIIDRPWGDNFPKSE